jgi:hypothetical protein
MKNRKWLWAFAVLPLVCASLVAQEPKDGDPKAPAQEQAPPEPAPGESTPADKEPDPPEEHVSADNNLSFPVDI